jgi:beta-galactosidase
VSWHEGGYLPFEVDLTTALGDGQAHELILRLDNRDNPDVPPGKPYRELDFCWYGGLYRGVELRRYPGLAITDANAAGEVAGGGVFLRTVSATSDSAQVHARVHVRNTGPAERHFRVQLALRSGATRATSVSGMRSLAAGEAEHVELELTLDRPQLWSPAAPALYHAEVTLLGRDGAPVDRREFRYGVRRLGFSRSRGFTINGEPFRLRGTNRHQEYPRVGYAAPEAAQRRDARRIKEAGFDYVRLSHYPQSPEFLDACDELGIVVMNAIPGWQYVGSERFRSACVENARQLVRRDRNHACVALWELSLNETAMPEELMAALHQAGHQEYPGDQMFTCGWIDRYDVYIHSRQHGRIHDWKNGDKALVVAEYGDWEFYAASEGFDQTTGAGVLAGWANSRKFRADGERGLRQQALNHLVALNDTLASPAVLDGQWAMFDYARGYHPLRAACGVMDIFRLPKFSYFLYRSQREVSETGTGWTGGPTVFIASHWTPASDLRVIVFSNCEEVELLLNGKSLGLQSPVASWQSQHLPHPQFVFDLPRFECGTLEAVGFAEARPVATHRVSTPSRPAGLELAPDTAGIAARPGEPDVLIVNARIVDSEGTLCVDTSLPVAFSVVGDAQIVGPSTVQAEAGVASIVVRLPGDAGTWKAQARALSDGAELEARWEAADPQISAGRVHEFAGDPVSAPPVGS